MTIMYGIQKLNNVWYCWPAGPHGPIYSRYHWVSGKNPETALANGIKFYEQEEVSAKKD